MEFIHKLNGYLQKIEEFVLSWSIILMALILVANVIGRVVFQKSLTFAEEISSILTICLTFAGVSYCARIGRHINMTALFDAVPKNGKKVFLFISSAITFVALLYLAYLSSRYVATVFKTGRYTSALQIPLWIPYLMLPIGFCCAGIQYFIILMMNIMDKDIVHTQIVKGQDDFAVEEYSNDSAAENTDADKGDDGL